MRIAVLEQRYALDQLHDEVGPAGGRLSRVEDLGDKRMIDGRERLPFSHEPRHDFLRVHAELHDLERDAPAHRLQLLGLVDGTHASFAQHAERAGTGRADRSDLQESAHASGGLSVSCSACACAARSRAVRALSRTSAPHASFEILGPTCRRQVEARMKEVLLAIVVVMSSPISVPSAAPHPAGCGRVRRSCARTATRARTPSHASPWRATAR